jgi:uncharacterized damage-inducible protein DinB
MNADAIRHLYNYHFAENRTLWSYIDQLTPEQFTQGSAYSHGSVRNQVTHLIQVDKAWFHALQGMAYPEKYSSSDPDDRPAIRALWDQVETDMRAYLAALTDEMLAEKPIEDPEEDQNLIAWQVLLHVINHGTDHRAQTLRLMNDLGVDTVSQDYIFYVYENAV